jgi:hypothetical protein
LLKDGFAALGPDGTQLLTWVLDAVRFGLSGALHDVFLAAGVIMASGAVMTLFLREIPLRKSFAPAPSPATQTRAGLSLQSR